MAKRTISVDVDEETFRRFCALGGADDVLSRLVHAASDGVHPGGVTKRNQTNQSLRAERREADADHARALHSGDSGSAAQAARGDRSDPDFLMVEREATNHDLARERVHSDTVFVDQREANARMVDATIRAQEVRDEADSAKTLAEGSARQLREVAELRELFVGILGHDLRNPLGSVSMGAAMLLRRGRLDPQDSATAARIIRASQRMTRMIAQLLDLTRTRLGGGLPIEPKPTDMSAICRDVVEEFEAPITLALAGDLGGTWDKDRLAELISNLAGNAIDYATPGTTVVVDARGDGEHVIVEVRNEGIPIAADVLSSIFEPFRRGNPRQRSPTGNLGLGLYIAKQIALSHGGSLDASCADGVTTFALRLPRTPIGKP
jgi:signal transduction histidine kinase